ncbi:hypothetical protein OPQ81_008074 [Rhizoctonia solani]|nr:hypothetical protein OPQ81_008074 [Rhizoctonia solani]
MLIQTLLTVLVRTRSTTTTPLPPSTGRRLSLRRTTSSVSVLSSSSPRERPEIHACTSLNSAGSPSSPRFLRDDRPRSPARRSQSAPTLAPTTATTQASHPPPDPREHPRPRRTPDPVQDLGARRQAQQRVHAVHKIPDPGHCVAVQLLVAAVLFIVVPSRPREVLLQRDEPGGGLLGDEQEDVPHHPGVEVVVRRAEHRALWDHVLELQVEVSVG